ncbi:MAG: hypothetical protein OXE94_05405 [Aestuariivita sp.]|nr:hypothetical protein [Aestuariivita sp.]MCY4202018.1 hypothetical protein [Aestuariivita sp.]MCY4288172.1 hypothetical protein [Aestuariivita sp.]MCY4346263.1 hypothetical protein [Aestuariivita sp.]
MENKHRQGEPLDDHVSDAFIAAVAVTCGLVVVSRNEAEFRNTGAKTINHGIYRTLVNISFVD